MLTCAVAVLFAATGSNASLEMAAVVETVPVAIAWAITVIVTCEPGSRLPRFAVSCPSAKLAAPCVVIAELKPSAGGSGSVTITWPARDGPVLVAVTVNVRLDSRSTGLGDAERLTARSDTAATRVVTVAELSAGLASSSSSVACAESERNCPT